MKITISMQGSTIHSLKWLLSISGQQQRLLAVSALLTVARVVLLLATPVWLYLLITELTAAQPNSGKATTLLLAAVGSTLAAYLCYFLAALFSHKAAFYLIAELRTRLCEQLLKLPLPFIKRQHSASLHQLLNEDVSRIELFVAHHLTDLLTALLTPLLVAALLAWFNWQLALIALLPLPLALLLQGLMFRTFADKAAGYYDALAEMNRQSNERIRGVAALRMLPGARTDNSALNTSIRHYKAVVESWMRDASWPFSLLKVMLDAGLLVLLPVTAWLTLQGELSIAEFLLFMMLGLTLTEPLYSLLMFTGVLNQIAQGVNRIIELEQCPSAPQGDASWPTRLPAIELTQLNFSHSSEAAPVLRDISLTIEPGEKIAIIGPSGCGKSTLLKLLCGYYPDYSGSITLDGSGLQQFDSGTLHAHIAVVMQQNHIFQRSLRDNLSLGLDVSDEQIWQALALSQATTLASNHPQGLERPLGGHGARLSGGEQQRLALARALLRQADIYLLDEATSALDPELEARLLQGLFQHLSRQTLIFVTHRIQTAQQADRILVLDAGQIAGFGSAEQLAQTCPLYRRLAGLAEGEPHHV